MSVLIHKYFTNFLQNIQNNATTEYFFCKYGEIQKEKYKALFKKFDDYYGVADNPSQRQHKYHYQKKSVVVCVAYLDNDKVCFVLMCRSNQAQTGLFFERESFIDIRKQNLWMGRYEFVRVNKEAYEFNDLVIKSKNEVWTVQISETYINELKKKHYKALLSRDCFMIEQVHFALNNLIGFAEVRKQFIELKNYFTQILYRFNQSQVKDKIQPAILLKSKLMYVRKNKIEYIKKL